MQAYRVPTNQQIDVASESECPLTNKFVLLLSQITQFNFYLRNSLKAIDKKLLKILVKLHKNKLNVSHE